MKSNKAAMKPAISAAIMILLISLTWSVPAQKVQIADPAPSPTPGGGPGQITQKYLALGGASGFLGPPTSQITRTSDGVAYYQNYRNGSIYWLELIGAHELHGPVKEKWDSMRRDNFLLGYPLTDVTPSGGGVFTRFEYGLIGWTPSTGAHEVHGAIRDKWQSLGNEPGSAQFRFHFMGTARHSPDSR